MSKPDTPQPPDYPGAAREQGAANIDAALAGTALATPNQSNPFGTTSWSNTEYDQAMQQWLAGKPGGGTGSGTGTYDPGADGHWSTEDYQIFGAGSNPLAPMTPIGVGGIPIGNMADRIGIPGPASVLGKGDDGSRAPSYTPSPEEQAYNNWLASRPDQKDYNKPGDWTLSTQFSPELQGLWDRTFDQPLDTGGVEANRNRAEEAVYSRATRYLDPQVAQQREALAAQLQNEGAMPGSEYYNYRMKQMEDQIGTTYADARDRAIGMGGTEADRSLHELLTTRELPFQELQTLKGLMPSANPSAQSVQASPILQAIQQAYNAQLQQYGTESAQYGSQMQAGGAALAAIIAALI